MTPPVLQIHVDMFPVATTCQSHWILVAVVGRIPPWRRDARATRLANCWCLRFFFSLSLSRRVHPCSTSSTQVVICNFYILLIIFLMVCFLFFRTAFLRQIRNLFWVLHRHFFRVTEGSFASNVSFRKHVQHLRPPYISNRFPTLFFVHFLYHNLSTCNAMFLSFQFFSNHFLYITLTLLTVNIHFVHIDD